MGQTRRIITQYVFDRCQNEEPDSINHCGWIYRQIATLSNERNPDVIYLLLGKDAQKVKRQIDSKITVLESSHPSGLSCNRGFLGCGHFKRINDLLIGRGLEPIDWNLD